MVVRIHPGKPLRVGGQYLSQPHKLEEVGATPASRDHFSDSAAANDGRSGASYASGKATPWFDSRCRYHALLVQREEHGIRNPENSVQVAGRAPNA